METERKWVVVRIDGKIAAISTDYRKLAEIIGYISNPSSGRKNVPPLIFNEISAVTVDFEEVWELRQRIRWEDLILFGTDFQKKVWRRLFDLTHSHDEPHASEDGKVSNRLISYSDFAGLCDNRAGVRAVAHAIGLNPVSVVIPCHLVVPKETIDKINDIRKKAEATIFKGDDLCLSSILNDNSIEFGEYGLGRRLKRKLINLEHHSL